MNVITRILFLILMLISAPSLAFKVDTHTWLAENIWQEIKDSGGYVSLGHLPEAPFASVKVPPRIRDSILTYKEAFIIGTMGADLYPDMIAGQMTTHPGLSLQFHEDSVHEDVAAILNLVGGRFLDVKAPGWQTDDWLKHVRDAAIRLSRSKRNQPSRELAFAYGYMLHAAMDTWAHSYVNGYSGDVFSIGSNQKAAARHVVLEGLINHIHEPFLGATAQGQISQRQSANQLRQAARQPRSVNNKQTDKLTKLRGPTQFIRRTLLLNNAAATQYSREKGALHVWAMWFWWQYSQQVTAHIDQTKGHLNGAYNTAVNRFTAYTPIWDQARDAKDEAVSVYEDLDTQRSLLEERLIAATRTLNSARSDLIGGIAGFPAVQTALDVAGGAIGAVLNLMTFEPLLSLKRTYINASAEVAKIDSDLSPIIEDWQAAKTYRDNTAATLAQVVREYDLRKNTRDALLQARNAGWRVVDQVSANWTRNIELAADAYIQAWEETIREIIRPRNSRFRPGPDPTWPIKEWVACWGPMFGMPRGLAVKGAATCGKALTTFNSVTTNLDLMVKNTLIPASVRASIDKLHHEFKDQVLVAMPMVARLVANGIGSPTLAGSATFAARAWDSDVDLDDAIREYQRDESNRNLPIFSGRNSLRAALELDNLPVGQSGYASYQSMLAFAPIHNAVMMSKLTLLDGNALNGLLRSKGITRKLYTGASFAGAPLYRASDKGGEVLVGAIRSIDGNHQWLPVAPDLPRGVYPSSDIRVTEQTCRRFGYPATGLYPIVNNTFPLDESRGGRLNCVNFESYPAYLQTVGLDQDKLKGGFRLWQDQQVRGAVFEKIFKGPLSLGLCNKLTQQGQTDDADKHGCENSVSPYPAAHDERISKASRRASRPSPQNRNSASKPATTNKQPPSRVSAPKKTISTSRTQPTSTRTPTATKPAPKDSPRKK